MPENVVRKHHSFFWNSDLTDERMEEIDAFLGSLTEGQRGMIRDMLDDARDEARWDERCDG